MHISCHACGGFHLLTASNPDMHETSTLFCYYSCNIECEDHILDSSLNSQFRAYGGSIGKLSRNPLLRNIPSPSICIKVHLTFYCKFFFIHIHDVLPVPCTECPLQLLDFHLYLHLFCKIKNEMPSPGLNIRYTGKLIVVEQLCYIHISHKEACVLTFTVATKKQEAP